MKFWVALLVVTAAAQDRQGVLSYERDGNRFLFNLSDGTADLEWKSPSTFRFRRSFGSQLQTPPKRDTEPVAISVNETGSEISLTTMFVKAVIRKDDLRIETRKAADDELLMKDLTAAGRHGGVISWERLAQPGVHYYGLGGRSQRGLNLRGGHVENAIPFLLSTAGYGEQHVAPGRYDFDIAHLRRESYRIEIQNPDTIDYYFYYGPTPKEIFEERVKANGVKVAVQSDSGGFQWLLEQSLSGVILPPEMLTRFLPSDLRGRLGAYLGAYIQEIYDRGCPILHPLPLQFPRDQDSDKYVDESMLGDELLLAMGKSVYLPQGIWTNLQSNAVFHGRQVIQTTETPSVFARNGSIVPLAAPGTLELHYFPKLGAEFFIFEEDVGDYSQVHAAPAADILRLEIESKVARDYTWVVHHIDAVKNVMSGEARFMQVQNANQLTTKTWCYDAANQSLYVRDRVAAGQDHIVNLSF